MDQVEVLNVAIVGGGPGCKAIMNMIFAEKLSQLRMKLIGVADFNPGAVGYCYAQEKGIYTTKDYRDLYRLKDLNMIIEVTGRDEVANEIHQTRPRHVRVMDNVTARLFWDIFQIEEERLAERKQAEEVLRDTVNRLQIAYEQSITYARELNQEIGERERAEEAVRKSEERYRRITEAVIDYVFTVRIEDGHPVETVHGPACVAVTGYTPDEFASDPYLWIRMVHEEDHAAVQEQAGRVLSGQDVPPIEHRILRKDGVLRWVRNTLVPHHDPEGNLLSYDGLIRDIHERKEAEEAKAKLEAQLRHAQKMEAIGTLAGGIAHDFNNLLMGILGATSLMLMDIDSGHPYFEHLKVIEDMVHKGAGLTRQLLGLAKGGKYEVKPTDLNELIKKSSKMFGRTKREIKIHRKYQKDIWTLEVDQGQIEQVLLNLYVNAWQAMPGGGTLYIKTENVTLDEDYVKPFGVQAGHYVKISVRDTGVGMDEETQRRIFEPFFTTKEMGRGTGLGLASAYGIIKNHGGIINVYSEKGEGTTFNIYLPAVEAMEIGARDEESGFREKEIQRGDETILLVDDEDTVIDVGQKVLKKLGYKVFVARSGQEAIEVLSKAQRAEGKEQEQEQEGKERSAPDLVILDMIMPDMGGDEVYDKMKQINRKIKVLLSSGYGIDGHVAEILDRGCDGFIQKPFTIKQLSKSIRKVLEKK